MKRQDCFHKTRYARSSDGVPEVAFDRTDSAELAFRCGTIEHPAQGGDFDRIADGCRRAMGFDVADGFGVDVGQLMGHCDRVGLAFDAGRRKTGFVATVVVDPEAFDDCVNPIAAFDGIIQTLDHDATATVTEQCSGGT